MTDGPLLPGLLKTDGWPTFQGLGGPPFKVGFSVSVASQMVDLVSTGSYPRKLPKSIGFIPTINGGPPVMLR